MITVDAIELQGSLMPWSIITEVSTWSKWSHVVMILSNGDMLDSAPFRGVTVRKYERRNNMKWRKSYNIMPYFGKTTRNEMYKRGLSQLGQPYDWSWIFGYTFNQREWEKEDSWVCFEYVSWVMMPWMEPEKNLNRITGRHVERALDELIKKGG